MQQNSIYREVYSFRVQNSLFYFYRGILIIRYSSELISPNQFTFYYYYYCIKQMMHTLLTGYSIMIILQKIQFWQGSIQIQSTSVLGAHFTSKILNDLIDSQCTAFVHTCKKTNLCCCTLCKKPFYHWVPFCSVYDKQNKLRCAPCWNSMISIPVQKTHYHCIWKCVSLKMFYLGNQRVGLFFQVNCCLRGQTPFSLSEKFNLLISQISKYNYASII